MRGDTAPVNRVTFPMAALRARHRPQNYLAEMRGCATRVTAKGWEYDTDAPCYRWLVEKYADYRPTPEDVERAETFKAAHRAKRDERMRAMWAALHGRAAATTLIDP